MDFNLISNIESCFVVLPKLLYYSHIPTALSVILIGALVYFTNRKLLASRILFFVSVTFSFWVALDLMLWVPVDGSVIMFFWSIINLFELLTSAGVLYFSFVFLEQKDVSLKIKSFVSSLFVLFIFLIPTSFNLGGFTLASCEAQQGPLTQYFYFMELFFSLWLLAYLSKKIFVASKENRWQVLLFSFGVVFFLFSFSGANILASATQDWHILQYGLFSAPVFAGLLAYLIVRHKAFNIKLLGAQALTVTLWVLVGALFFLSQNTTNRIVTGVTFLLVVVFGFKLMQSVKREVEQREQIEELAGRLKSVNRIMSHDIKNVLGKNKDMFGMLLDGTFGALSESARGFLERAHDDTKKLIRSVVVILESGQDLILKSEPFDLKEAVLEVVHDTEPDAKAKGLALTTAIDEKEAYTIIADRTQLVTHVLRNLIENAIHYTLAGTVTVGLSKKDANTVLFSVTDTGIGIPDEDKPNIFKEGGHGKDSIKVNVHSTGYGLYSVKRIVDAHGGKVWFETEAGKGTTFFVELPR